MNEPLITKAQLVKTLQENSAVEVTFTKKSDGSVRVMLCTLNSEVIAQDGGLKTDSPKPERKTPEHLVHVYDVEASAWRSFDINSVISISM